jgi:transketolase
MSEQKGTRDGFGQGIIQAAELHPEVIVLGADLDDSLRLTEYKAKFPDRFIQVGVAEQNLAGTAAGLALAGLTPFITSYASFSPGRNWEQIRTTICFSNLPVKIVGGHAGLTTGEDGASAQAMEDLALTLVLPNMTVVVPCDAAQATAATLALATTPGPGYLRLSREASPDLTSNLPFVLGKAQILRLGTDATIFATGMMVELALKAAQTLQIHNWQVQVVNLHTLKPLDQKAIITAANQNGVIVTAEEHQLIGGLGARVSQVITSELGRNIHQPTVLESVAMADQFGESGPAASVMEKFHLTAQAIVTAVETAMTRKSQL